MKYCSFLSWKVIPVSSNFWKEGKLKYLLCYSERDLELEPMTFKSRYRGSSDKLNHEQRAETDLTKQKTNISPSFQLDFQQS